MVKRFFRLKISNLRKKGRKKMVIFSSFLHSKWQIFKFYSNYKYIQKSIVNHNLNHIFDNVVKIKNYLRRIQNGNNVEIKYIIFLYIRCRWSFSLQTLRKIRHTLDVCCIHFFSFFFNYISSTLAIRKYRDLQLKYLW